MKKPVLYLVILFMFTGVYQARSSHYLGGSISWECLSNGKYKFYLRIYSDCGASTNYPNQQNIFYGTTNQISLTLLPGYPKDVSPQCNSYSGFTHITCSGAGAVSNTGAVSEYLYASQEIQLNGIPPVTGWVFKWTGCCRAPAINLSNSASGWYIKAVMYPYKGRPAYPCYDNSPDFAEPPLTINSLGYTASATFSAFDDDLDELKYNWGKARNSNGVLQAYSTGYSYSSPLPGPLIDSNNVAAVLDTNTGFLTFTDYTVGSFVVNVNVSSYRDGIKIAEVSREMQIVLTQTDSNTAPDFLGMTASIYRDTLMVGDSVNILLTAYDNQQLPNNTYQSVVLSAYGNEFGAYVPPGQGSPATYSQQTGCIKPPCAVLTPAPSDTAPLTNTGLVSTSFKWKTDTAHVQNGPYLYNFFISSKDDRCPVPARRTQALSFYVIPDFAWIKPELLCTQTQDNGDVILRFNTTVDTNNSFNAYYIYSSLNKNGPFTVIDSITNVNTGTYVHTGANANVTRRYYYILMKTTGTNTGKVFYAVSNVLSTIMLSSVSVSSCVARFEWNRPEDSLITAPTGYVYLYKKINAAGTWFIADSISNLARIAFDKYNYNGDTVFYRILFKAYGLKDSTGQILNCYHKSNIIRVVKSNLFDVSPPVLCTGTNSNGDIEISWEKYKGITGGFNYYKLYYSTHKQGPYVDWQTITSSSITSLTFPMQGMSGQQYFYIETGAKDCYNNSYSIQPYDTVSNIWLSVGGLGTNNLVLHWNEVRPTPLTGTAPLYYIRKLNSNGMWQIIDSTVNTSYPVTVAAGDSADFVISTTAYDRAGHFVCDIFSNTTSYLKMGINNIGGDDFVVYDNVPNPFSDFTELRFRSPSAGNFSLRVFDMQGKELICLDIKAVKGENRFKISAANLGAGIYIYKISDGRKTVVKRFTVE